MSLDEQRVALKDGGEAVLRPMKAGAMFRFMELDADSPPSIIRFLAMTATNADGAQLYVDEAAVDEAAFSDIKAIADAAMQVNGLTEASAELLGNV